MEIMSQEERKPKSTIAWRRTPLERDQLLELTERSDLLGMLQSVGYLGLLAVTGTTACLLVGRIHWAWIVAIVFFHGTCWAFMINGFHELVHNSVFKTRWLNPFFLRILSFFGWHNHVLFWASHTEHHKYTLHAPDDLEVVLPADVRLEHLYKNGLVNPRGIVDAVQFHYRLARLKLVGDWENALFPESSPDKRRALANWSRFVLIGHAAILVVSLALGWWMVPVVVTFARFYGSWLHQLCNNTQHIGLTDQTPDFRLSCRTFTCNPFVQFLYWHMNFHVEHHMYAAVPCYRLGKLHRLIRHDLPHTPHGLYATWKQIIPILERQRKEPGYQYAPEVPELAAG
jgi:fatty acid desaturase